MDLKGISEAENGLISEARERYAEYYEHAQYAVDLLHSMIKEAKPEGYMFVMFLMSMEKHVILGILSGIRLHHVQSTLDFRYAMESGCWAAYGLAHQDQTKFVETADNGYIEPTKKLKAEMYKWIEKNYPAGNASIKPFKDQLNALSSHSNLVDASRNFSGMAEGEITTSLFDDSEDHHVKTDLWTGANLTMGLLDLFYGVRKDYPVITFVDDFLERFKVLRERDAKLKAEMLQHPRIKAHA